MLKRKFPAMMLVLLLMSMSVSVFEISQVRAISSSPFYIPERVEVIPEQPYPNDEVNVIISFILNQANAEYTVTQEGNTFDIYVTIFRTVIPVVKRVVLNVSLGQLPLGSYQVNIKGVYYPKTIRFTVDFVHTINHFVEIYGYPFRIITQSNSTVSAFMFNLEEKKIRFNVSHQDNTVGFCNVTIPKMLLDGDFLVLVDDSSTSYFLTENSTHSFVYFLHAHSMHTVKIAGTIIAEPPLPRIFRVPDVNPTIQEAVDTANPGDTIRVREGTCCENLLVDKTVSLVGENQTTTIIDGESEWYYIVIAVIAHSVTISGFTIQKGIEGILIGADGCNINHNIITNNSYGLILCGSDNSINGNNILQNVCGIWVDCGGNKIYHNNIINNVYHVYVYQIPEQCVNTWDDGYPSGGNYWSDYTGADLYYGQYQNESGSDEIGDMSYTIDSDNRDNYPLMKPYPWVLHDIGITSVTTSKAIVGQGYNMSINVMLFNYGDYTETTNITIHANSTILSEVYNVDLASRTYTTVNFTWNTSSWSRGNYTLWVYAWPVPDETNAADNNYTYGKVIVTIPGDFNGDRFVYLNDKDIFSKAWYSREGDSNYNPNCDLDDDGFIYINDLDILGRNWYTREKDGILTYVFLVVLDGYTFYVTVESNSTVSNFYFNQPMRTIGFSVTGQNGTFGFCNVTIPRSLLDCPEIEYWQIWLDTTDISSNCPKTRNETHTFIHIPYTHSTHQIIIRGTYWTGNSSIKPC